MAESERLTHEASANPRGAWVGTTSGGFLFGGIMAGKRRDLTRIEGRNIVERAPRGKSRLHGDVIPPFMAWLRVQARRYQKIRDALNTPKKRDGIPGGEQTYWAAINSLATITSLQCNLGQQFDTKDWREEIEAVGEALGWEKPSWCEIPLIIPTPSIPGTV